MDYKIRIILLLYYLSLIGVLILYLFPGSLIGYFVYGSFARQPDLIPNPLGTSINHALTFFVLSILGLISYSKNKNFNINLVFLIVLSLLLEISHIVIPNRSFEYLDLFANLLGTGLAIVIIFFYKRIKNGKV